MKNEYGEDMAWRCNNSSDSHEDVLDRKLYQLESLGSLLYGEGGAAFRNMNPVIQDGVMWLVHDLVIDMRESKRAMVDKRRETPSSSP